MSNTRQFDPTDEIGLKNILVIEGACDTTRLVLSMNRPDPEQVFQAFCSQIEPFENDAARETWRSAAEDLVRTGFTHASAVELLTNLWRAAADEFFDWDEDEDES